LLGKPSFWCVETTPASKIVQEKLTRPRAAGR
jgi:hypothetical protein